MRQQIDEALDRWVDAGLVADDQASAIRTFEDDRAPAVTAEASGGSGVPWLGEALAYVGAAFAFGAGALVLGETWDSLGSGGRIALAGAATLALALGARALWSETATAGRRLATVLAVLAGVGVAGTVAITLDELTTTPDAWRAAATGAVLLAAVVPVHRLRPCWPTVLALGPGVLLLVFGVLDGTLLDLGQVLSGSVLAGLGLAWAAAGWSGLVRPRGAFEVTGLFVGGIGCQMLAGFESAGGYVGLLLGLVVALGAVAVGVTEERVAPTVFGGIGLTVFAPQFVLRLVDGELAGPLALLVTGLVLVLASVLVLRTRREALS